MTEIIDDVARSRATLIDAWEATALIESFGYTDSRVEREFGFANTLALGTHVFDLAASRPTATPPSDEEPRQSVIVTLFECIGASVVYAVPWFVTFVVEFVRPDLLRLPGAAGPPLSISLMLSLIISGGFIQAICRRGEFYIGIRQPALAALVCSYMFRLGAITAMSAAVIGVGVGWYFELFSWPYLVLAADQFIILCVLWMTCGILSIRHEHWRTPLAFAAGAAAFALLRSVGIDALLAQLVAAATVLAAALVQVWWVFGSCETIDIPAPRCTVLLYRVLPYFWYGAAYFCFLFADRFAASASVAALSGAPFGMRQDYKLGMDLALLTFLFASAIVEFANLRFTDLLTDTLRKPATRDAARLAKAVGGFHRRVAVGVLVGYVVVALLFAKGAVMLLPPEPPTLWMMLAIGDVAYLLLAIGLLNALILFSLNAPWAAVRALTAALALNIAVGAALSHAVNTYFAAAGLVSGAMLLAVLSVASIGDVLSRIDHAVATF